MEPAIRNKLRNTVTQCRKRLEESIAQILQGHFGIYHGDKGEVHVEGASRMTHLSEEDQAYREDILGSLEHIKALDRTPKESLDQLIREIAFTHLNRLCAYKMMEARQVWIGGQRFREAVSRGQKSQGFIFYLADHPEDEQLSRTGQQDMAYRHFLDWLGSRLSEEIGVLFSPNDPANRLYPPQRVLDEVLALINSEDLAGIWTDDETIGWVYQYFTPKDLRDQARKKSQAPRNSYELAFRNQFFTPRYVVEFLTDNTLGRTWYEMCQGATRLVEQCRYMIRRPNEVFLREGESAPETADENTDDFSQEALLKQPTYIPHRPKKDPRELKILDPACGSGHFLLYCFDLLQTIYEEAYDDPDSGPRLKKDYLTLDALRRDVPGLILRCNLYGIDIDPRAMQIAALTLWLRAQRVYQSMDFKADRPRIARTNIVCAEPMPGERALLDEFVTGLHPPVLGQLVRMVFDKMQLAGEAGSLLKIEADLADAIAEAKKQWLTRPKAEQLTLWPEAKRPTVEQLGLFDVSGITDEEFWCQAEGRVLDALHTFARRAANSTGLQRQLFADDAARGFAFIEMCRKRFDVVLMNPPFGDASTPSKGYIEEVYCDTKGDVYKAFVECFQDRLVPRGFLGIISSRAGFFLRQSSDWRERIVLRLYRPLLLADFGQGVLDAMVETAAYVLQTISEEEDRDLTLRILPDLLTIPTDGKGTFSIPKYQARRGGLKRHQATQELRRLRDGGYIAEVSGHYRRFQVMKNVIRHAPAPRPLSYPPILCYRLLDHSQKEHALLDMLRNPQDPDYFVTSPRTFQDVSGAPFSYWVSERVRRLFTELPPFEGEDRMVRVGLQTSDDFRFLRVWWEVSPERILDGANGPGWREDLAAFQTWCRQRTCEGKRWVPFAKGGAYSPYYADLHLVVNWERDGEELKAWADPLYGNSGWSRIIKSVDFYFRPGLTWPLRTQLGFNMRAYPAGATFGHKGPVAFAPQQDLSLYLGLSNSSTFAMVISLQMAFGSYEVGVVQRTPVPSLSNLDGEHLGELARSAVVLKQSLDTPNETSHVFVLPAVLQVPGNMLIERAEAWRVRVAGAAGELASLQQRIDELTYRLYGIAGVDRQAAQVSPDDQGTPEDAEAEEDDTSIEEEGASVTDPRMLVSDLLSYTLGTALGRWDIRYATNERSCPELPDPFAPLPVCSPGMLSGEGGLPLHEAPTGYPLRLDQDGMLVDDADHPDDIVRRVRDVLEALWQDRAEAIEREACKILGVKELRDYFCKPGMGGFWDDHISRYSKSRRKAPIYWPLQSSKAVFA
jgi:hypothetical protein